MRLRRGTPHGVGHGAQFILVSGALAYSVAIAAVASYVMPSSGSILALAASNWCTGLGALCFFIGALRILPHVIRPVGRR